jgi:hypothetical protein
MYYKNYMDNKKIKNLIKSGASLEDLGNKLGITKQAIWYRLKKLGLKTIGQKTRAEDWTLKELQYLKHNYRKTEIDLLSSKLKNRSLTSIRRKAFELGLKKDNSIYKHTIPKSNLNNLLQDSLEAFYWIGFLFADGCIDFKRNSISIKLSIKDQKHLQKYSTFIESTNKIYQSVSICTAPEASKNCLTKQVCVSSTDKSIVPKIIDKFSFKQKKSYNPPLVKLFKKFPTELLVSFIIGFIDGDGTVESPYYRLLPSGNKQITSPRIGVECHHSWKEFFDFMIEVLDLVTKEKLPKAYTRQREGKQDLAVIRFNRKSTLTYLKNFIEKNKLPVLERKWDKVVI